MSAFFVTGAGTEIGKTYVSCALIQAWRMEGHWVDAVKPVVTGFDAAQPEGSDPALLIEALGRNVSAETLDYVAPLRFKAPLAPPLAARQERRNLSMLSVATTCQGRVARATRSMLLIEGAGGVMSPIADDATVVDLIQRLDVPAIFVSGTYLGAVSHTLSGLEVLAGRGVEVAAVVVSESADSSVGLEDTCNLIEDHGVARRLWVAPRGATAWAAPLARALADRNA